MVWATGTPHLCITRAPEAYLLPEASVSHKASNLEQFTRWHSAMLERGVYLAPSQFESGFVSVAHTEEIVDQTIAAAKEAMLAVAAAG